VHGLLHLAGHEDADEAERKAMEESQERIIEVLWNESLGEKLVP
jgi:ssRNA-specific RNase YbeY (16S rRNA maturation enzyme)